MIDPNYLVSPFTWGWYEIEPVSVQANATSVSGDMARPQKGIFKGVFHTPDFGLRTRRWMSAFGYEQTYSAGLLNVRV